MSIFTKKYSNLGSLEFFDNENFDACLPKIWIGTFKIVLDLWLRAVFCKIKKKKYSTLIIRQKRRQRSSLPVGGRD